uniref:Replication factor-A protein 1 N-terminal domain-containing protein n=1 Tax=Chenopodium quinoa TaxID=63459 RepID=A0A803MA53_CHEQI
MEVNTVTPDAILKIIANPSPDSSKDLPDLVVQVIDLKAVDNRFMFIASDGKQKLKGIQQSSFSDMVSSGSIQYLGLIRVLDYTLNDILNKPEKDGVLLCGPLLIFLLPRQLKSLSGLCLPCELCLALQKRQKSAPSNVGKAHKARVIPPFKRLLSKLPTWSLMVANAMHSWVYHVDLRQEAWFSAVPWSMMALVGYFGGAWSDTLIQRGFSITLTRKNHSIGFIGPGIALIGLTTATSPSIASAWLTLAVGLKLFSHSGFLVNIQGVTLVCLLVALTASPGLSWCHIVHCI